MSKEWNENLTRYKYNFLLFSGQFQKKKKKAAMKLPLLNINTTENNLFSSALMRIINNK